MTTAIATTATKTMTSLELVALINSERKEGKAQMRHTHFITKLEKHPGIDSAKFLAQYQDDTGRTLKCYRLPEREAKLMVMSESLEVQTKVYDRMTALEAAKPPVANALPSPEQRAASIANATMQVAALFGVPMHLAQIESVKAARTATGVDFGGLLNVSPAQDHIADDDVMLEPTELAVLFGVKPHSMNLYLEGLGLQERRPGGWHPTEKGKAISTRHAWSAGGKSGYNLKWRKSAVQKAVAN